MSDTKSSQKKKKNDQGYVCCEIFLIRKMQINRPQILNNIHEYRK